MHIEEGVYESEEVVIGQYLFKKRLRTKVNRRTIACFFEKNSLNNIPPQTAESLFLKTIYFLLVSLLPESKSVN